MRAPGPKQRDFQSLLFLLLGLRLWHALSFQAVGKWQKTWPKDRLKACPPSLRGVWVCPQAPEEAGAGAQGVTRWVRQLRYDESENVSDDESELRTLHSDGSVVQHGSLNRAVKRRTSYNVMHSYLVQRLSSSNSNPHFAQLHAQVS